MSKKSAKSEIQSLGLGLLLFLLRFGKLFGGGSRPIGTVKNPNDLENLINKAQSEGQPVKSKAKLKLIAPAGLKLVFRLKETWHGPNDTVKTVQDFTKNRTFKQHTEVAISEIIANGAGAIIARRKTVYPEQFVTPDRIVDGTGRLIEDYALEPEQKKYLHGFEK